MAATTLRRYLDRYAEPIVAEFEAQLRSQIQQTYAYVLVIPLYVEPLDCLDRILPSTLKDTLVIAVVNVASDRPTTSVQVTQGLLAHLRDGEAPLTWVSWSADTAMLIVDCCSPGRQLPAKQGVGLARKIGADLAVACIEAQVVINPWIYCTDADVTLPQDYFDGRELDPDVAVALYPFCHQPIHTGILQYEISLRYYVTQLAIAGSPYGFHTIGSLLKINATHYVGVRGFPKRAAAEDFYILNKLAKTGKVVQLQGSPIVLSSRVSTRVPFGTGATMERLATESQLKFYDPKIFQCLQQWLALIEPLWQQREAITQSGLMHWWHRNVNEGDLLLETLLQLGLEKTLPQAYRQCRDYQRFQFFLWVWFDAFRTLKFVHGLRDRAFPSQSLSQIAPLMNWNDDFQTSLETNLELNSLKHINNQLIAQESQLPTETGPTGVFAKR